MKLTKRNVMIYSAVIVLLVVAVVIGSNKSFSTGTVKGNGLEIASESKIMVKTQPVKTLEKITSMSYKANIEPSEEAIVSTKLSGKVVKILFENGNKVSNGDPLVILDNQDISNQLKAAEVNIPKLQANLEASQRNYDRAKSMFEQGAATQVQMENADTALKVAKADLAALQINIQVLKDNLNNTVIKAPITGMVDEKSISLGQFVSTGMTLAKVKNVSTLNAVIQVEQGNLKYIKEGMKAQIKLEDDDSQSFEGTVKSIDLGADPSARTFECKISIDNRNMELRPGVFAKAELSSDQKREAIVIPIQALSGSEGNYSVFTVQDGKAQKRSVSVGEISNDTAEILSGLEKDESIIISNLNILQDGDAVAVSEQGE